jgi:hypothetical protein
MRRKKYYWHAKEEQDYIKGQGLVWQEGGKSVAQWLRHFAASRKIAGSRLDELNELS